MHAINNVPLIGATDRLFHFIEEAGTPFSRFHNTGGTYGKDVEIYKKWRALYND